MKKNIVAGLDIGTTKVYCVIAEKEDEQLKIIGTGYVSSKGGMRSGLISNIGKMSDVIKEAVSKASEQAGVKVSELNIGIAGEHIRSIKYTGYVPITGENGEVVKEDLERLANDVKRLNSSKEMVMLHILPLKYLVDGVAVEDPLNMTGTKLEGIYHIIMASVSAVKNIEKAVNMAGYSVRSKVLQPLASSMAVLDENEKDLGVILIDIGGGTTDVAVFKNKRLIYTGIIGYGGDKITNSIRETFSIVTEEAEKVKRTIGYALNKAIVNNNSIRVPGVGATEEVTINAELLTQIINNIMQQIFERIDFILRQEKIKRHAKAGIVITGGGALLRGVDLLATDVLGLKAKLGLPTGYISKVDEEIEKPEYATALGLIKEIPGITSEQSRNIYSAKKQKNESAFSKFFKKVKEVFDEL